MAYDSNLQAIRNALGTHSTISRVQGNKLKAEREIRVASLFREVPPEFLKMLVVHELAHLKEREHDKAFYPLCTSMEPDYHQLEFDLRLYTSLKLLHHKTETPGHFGCLGKHCPSKYPGTVKGGSLLGPDGSAA